VMSESMTMSRPELLAHLSAICSACDLGDSAAFSRSRSGREPRQR